MENPKSEARISQFSIRIHQCSSVEDTEGISGGWWAGEPILSPSDF
jgi:hypothetical protein